MTNRMLFLVLLIPFLTFQESAQAKIYWDDEQIERQEERQLDRSRDIMRERGLEAEQEAEQRMEEQAEFISSDVDEEKSEAVRLDELSPIGRESFRRADDDPEYDPEAIDAPLRILPY